MELSPFHKKFILFSTLIVGMCSIIYELLISTVSSYFLGDSVKQFSIIIGFYLAFMGLGSWLSRYIKKDLMYNFIVIELLLGLVGAFSVPLSYIYFSYADFGGFNLFVLSMVGVIGTLTGMEVPVLTNILSTGVSEVKDELSDVLTLDYLGALVATLLFPFLLIPFMGVYKSSLMFGFINMSIGMLNFYVFRKKLTNTKKRQNIIMIFGFALMALVALAFFQSKKFLEHWNNNIFKHPVVYTETSPYQAITLTKNPSEFRLYLNGAIQFSSRDEYRYHESLVHVPAQQLAVLENVLILGGGEGLAAREVLKYNSVKNITLIDLDPAVTKLSAELPLFTELNEGALSHPKVQVHNADAFTWLLEDTMIYDFIIVDLPDPSNETLSRLYSKTFYTLIENRLSQFGLMVTQATSPDLSHEAFWCIDRTIASTSMHYTYPFHASVPSFGDWGFVIGSRNPIDFHIRKYIDMKFVDEEFLKHCFFFAKDITTDQTTINQMDSPVLMEYYLDHWQSLQAEPR